MRHIITVLIALFFIMNMIGCATVEFPRQASVKVIVDFTLRHCNEDRCITSKKRSTASGAIIGKHYKTYILTAGHVCDIEYARHQLGHDDIIVEYSILDVNGLTFPATVYKLDAENDLCIMKVQRLGHMPIKFRSAPPTYGEKVYSIGAPAGLASKNYVPILEGRYSGFNDYGMVFTVPAVGGSSGSPILDDSGRLVGMIMSVNNRFPFVSYSPHHHAIEKILEGIR